jgi:hypothetical protein
MTSSYPHGFAGGVNVRGLPLLNTYAGNVFWVDSGTGSNGNKGTFDRPFATIDYAVGKCTANNGDVIMVKPGHAETVIAAAGLDLDVAGITIIGLGTGSDRPTVTFSTATSADMDVDAANITVMNILFKNGINNLTAPIDVNAANFRMIDCETYDNDTDKHCDDFILTDANADGLYIEGWVHNAQSGLTGAQTAISIVGGDNITIIPKWIVGDFATACIENVTTACTNLQVFGSANFPAYLRTENTADVIFTAVSTTKGRVGPFINARLQDDSNNITEAFVGADMEFFQPINIVNADGESSLQTNITASTDTA